MKIISGGQTGVDRAALDAALRHKVPCGGWCPAGRLDESGKIPDRYPLTEMPNGDFADRTRQNVVDSDASIIFYSGKLQGGTEYTLKVCEEIGRPHLVIDAAKTALQEAATQLREFVRHHEPNTINVAGPRQSEWPDGYKYAFGALDAYLRSPVENWWSG